MTHGELIQRIQSLYSKGVESDDTRLSNRHIYNKICSVRIRLINEKIKKRQKLRPQILPCVELENVPVSECQCIEGETCKVKRSKHPIPKNIMNRDNYIIYYVTTVDGKQRFNPVDFSKKHYKSGRKYAKETHSYYILNDYLYVEPGKSHEGIEIVLVAGQFEETIIPPHFMNCGCDTNKTDNCESYLDREFPLDGDLIEALVELSKLELIHEFVQMREDKSNNSSDIINEVG